MIADISVTDAVALLNKNPDYRVILRISPRSAFSKNDGQTLLRGVVLDTETTGTNADQDSIQTSTYKRKTASGSSEFYAHLSCVAAGAQRDWD